MTGLLAGAAACAVKPTPSTAGQTSSPAAGSSTPPASAAHRLAVTSRTIEVRGKAAKVFGLTRPDGRPGLTLDAGALFDVELANQTGEATLIHWHGLTPPWEQDGVPDNPAALLGPGETRRYVFPVGAGGTHWMHAHTLQEQALLAAPLIVRTADDRQRDEHEVIMLLHDFSFRSAEELLADLQGGGGHAGMGMNMGGMSGMTHDMGGMAMPGMMTGDPRTAPMMGGAVGMMGMDLNDIDYDAYLANDRSLDDPEIHRVEKGGAVRLRIINGATATAFTIHTGSVSAELIAVDGQPVAPVPGHSFPMSMGQRIDLRMTLPQGDGAYPILALREGAVERTGIILATPAATIGKIASSGEAAAPLVDLGIEGVLRPLTPVARGPVARRHQLMLTGNMSGYTWSIQGAAPSVRKGEWVEVSFMNHSMMSHPMHLHGHHFQVVGINGRRFEGAWRDTVLVPSMSSVDVAFEAGNAGRWPLHCHHLYHMATGMMTFVDYGA
jgi:FtsP/CotA-like multicopper oxidase with cupredoxin domain